MDGRWDRASHIETASRPRPVQGNGAAAYAGTGDEAGLRSCLAVRLSDLHIAGPRDRAAGSRALNARTRRLVVSSVSRSDLLVRPVGSRRRRSITAVT